jgi:hypothetical protein
MTSRGHGRAATVSSRAEISEGLERLGLASYDPKAAAKTSSRAVMAEERHRLGIASHAPAHMRRMQEQRHSLQQPPVEKHEMRRSESLPSQDFSRAAGGAAPRGRASHSPLPDSRGRPLPQRSSTPLEMREMRRTQERRVEYLRAREASLDRQVQAGVRRLKELAKSLTQTDELEAAEDAIEKLESEVAITTGDVEELLARIQILALERGELEAAMGLVVELDEAVMQEKVAKLEAEVLTTGSSGPLLSPRSRPDLLGEGGDGRSLRGPTTPRTPRGGIGERVLSRESLTGHDRAPSPEAASTSAESGAGPSPKLLDATTADQDRGNVCPLPSSGSQRGSRSRRGSLDRTAALRALSASPACAASSSQEGGGSGPEVAEGAHRHDGSLWSPLRVSMLGAASASPLMSSLLHSLHSSRLEVSIYKYRCTSHARCCICMSLMSSHVPPVLPPPFSPLFARGIYYKYIGTYTGIHTGIYT